ncbi:hypothetical protein Tco_1076471, partial [Tanacetum coccineum]
MKSHLDALERLGYAMPNELAIRESKIQKNKKKPQGAKGKAKGKNKLAYAPKTKILPPPKRDNPTKDSICHHYKEGLRESRKLKHGALSMYMGNGMRAAVEAIRSFGLILPSVIIEYLVKLSKRRAFWSLNEDILKIYDSDNQYAISIKEDTAYPFLHSPKTTKNQAQYAVSRRRLYT